MEVSAQKEAVGDVIAVIAEVSVDMRCFENGVDRGSSNRAAVSVGGEERFAELLLARCTVISRRAPVRKSSPFS